MKLLSPFHKGHVPSFEQSVKFSPRNDLYQVWWNLTQKKLMSEKIWMNTWTDRQTDRQ